MSLKISKALRNAVQERGSFKRVFSNIFLKLYQGSQPATAEAAPTGTLLGIFSDNAGAITREVYASGTVTLTGGASGSVDTVAVNGIALLSAAVLFDTSLTVTAANVATSINNNPANLFIDATSSGAVITLKARPGMGAAVNGWSVVSTTSTITKTDANMASGVTAVNGLKWGDAADGVIVKLPTQTWSGVGLATGTAGWFRFEGSVTDPGTIDSTETYMRMDGLVATSGAELNRAVLSITEGTTYSITDFSVTFPTL